MEVVETFHKCFGAAEEGYQRGDVVGDEATLRIGLGQLRFSLSLWKERGSKAV